MHIQTEALSKALAFFNLDGVYQTISEVTVDRLEDCLKYLFTCQKLLKQATPNLTTDTSDSALVVARAAAATLV